MGLFDLGVLLGKLNPRMDPLFNLTSLLNAAQPPNETLTIQTQSLLRSISVTFRTIIGHSELIFLGLGEAKLRLNVNRLCCLFV